MSHSINPETSLPRIAVFAGPTATILNTPDLVTSNKARSRHSLPLRGGRDLLRPQRLAAAATLYIEAFSAHPLEADAADLYAPPDGWIDSDGAFHQQQPSGSGATPVYVVEIHPDDGLYPLPYMARQSDGSAWEEAGQSPRGPADTSRQTFYPDAERLYEEIERFGIADHGESVALESMAQFEFFRAAPSAGWTSGPSTERPGRDFFAYYPYHLQQEPDLGQLALATNLVQRAASSGRFAGIQWLEGSPTVDETVYWLGLLVDTTIPIVGHAAQRRHQSLSADGDRNVVDGVKYISSGASLGPDGADRIGACVIVDELVYAARDVTKVDARPGGYEVTGGHGGIVADMGGYGSPQITYIPTRKHTKTSDLRLPKLPQSVTGARGSLDRGVSQISVAVRDDEGLIPESIPMVTITKYSRFTDAQSDTSGTAGREKEIEVLARVTANLKSAPLAGFVCEGMSPFAMADPARNAALAVAAFAGMPVARTGRGNTGGMAYRNDPTMISGNNLTSTKARLLLMACLLKFGALPPARDPFNPTAEEHTAVVQAVARYQEVFDSH